MQDVKPLTAEKIAKLRAGLDTWDHGLSVEAMNDIDDALYEVERTRALLRLLTETVGAYGRQNTMSSREHMGAVYRVARDVLEGKHPDPEDIAAWTDLRELAALLGSEG